MDPGGSSQLTHRWCFMKTKTEKEHSWTFWVWRLGMHRVPPRRIEGTWHGFPMDFRRPQMYIRHGFPTGSPFMAALPINWKQIGRIKWHEIRSEINQTNLNKNMGEKCPFWNLNFNNLSQQTNTCTYMYTIQTKVFGFGSERPFFSRELRFSNPMPQDKMDPRNEQIQHIPTLFVGEY